MSESKKGRYIGAGIVFVILIVFFLDMQGYLGHRVPPGNTTPEKPDITNLVTITIEQTMVDEFETAVGTISSRKETYITAKVPAHVKHIHVKPGDKVKANDLLITLDDRDLKAKLGQAQSGYEAAQAALVQSDNSFKRYQSLIQTGAATQAEFEHAEAQYEMSLAKVKEAENAIKELNVMLGFTELRSPYSGIVVEKMAEEGAIANPGVPLLRIEDPDQLLLDVFIPETQQNSVVIGKTLMVKVDSLEKEIPGKVDEIIPSSDPRSRSFMVRISLEQQPGLRSGTFGRCYLPSDTRQMILLDPAAVYRVGQLEMVRVVIGDRIETRMVRTGIERDGKIEILSGLESGDVVAVSEVREE